MSTAEIVSFTAAGLALGSFLNLTIDRLPRQQSIIHPPSHCDGCQRRLTPADLVPLASYLWLRGRCRKCGYRIPMRVPAVEAMTGAACGLAAYLYGWTPAAAVFALYFAVFIHLAFVDLKHSLILNVVVLPALLVVLATAPLGPLGQNLGSGEAYLRSLAGAGLGFGVMLLVYLASRGRVGAGDVKLAALLGAMLGFPQLIAGLLLGFVVGGVLGATLLMLRLKRRTDAIPYGPVLVASAGVVLIAGSSIYDWYLNLFW